MATRSESTRSVGIAGEERAAAFLTAKGFRIIERNFRTRLGEIDIIAWHGETLVFLEVKHWASFGFAEMEYAIDRRKQRRIIEVSKWFLKQKALGDCTIRYDVVFLGRNPNDIRCVEGAFVERA